MSRPIRSFVRRLGPRRMRTRLAVFYALLFLVIGAALLAVTYALSSHFLVPTSRSFIRPLSRSEQALLGLCKPLPASPTLLAKCRHLIDLVGAGPKTNGDTLAALRIASVIGFAVLVVAAGVLGWLVAGRALLPVRSMTEAAKRASELRLGERLALSGPDDELKELADTFDLMLERLDAAFTSQRRFVANAAHELRTPLTAMRTAIEVTLSKPERSPAQLEAMADRVKRAAERAEQTVEALLTLATSEAGATVHEPVDLATAVEDALDAAQSEIAQRRLRVECALQPARTIGDRVLLERMVANLVDNAIKHNSVDGWLAVRTNQLDGTAVIEIDNTGPEVSAEQIPTLFEPFVRAAERLDPQAGVGLGLSIAGAIATAHAATISAHPREGGGLEIAVSVPAPQH